MLNCHQKIESDPPLPHEKRSALDFYNNVSFVYPSQSFEFSNIKQKLMAGSAADSSLHFISNKTEQWLEIAWQRYINMSDI